MRNLHDILLKHMSVIYQCYFILHGCTFEKETLTQMSYCRFCEISKNNFFNTSGGCFCLKCDWLYNFPSFSCLLLLKISCLFHFNTKMKQENSSIRHRFNAETPLGKFVEISSILKGESMWKLWHRFEVEISTWIQFSKPTKYRWVFHVNFSMLFRSRIDVTTLLAVSFL